MEYQLEDPLPAASNDKFPTLFRIEIDHMPSKPYFQNLLLSETSSSPHLFVRQQIVSSIFHYSHHLDPFLSYLSINYMDRFLSTQSIQDWKPWIFKLVSIACISLAMKMRKSQFFFSDIMNDGAGLIYNSPTIKRMEMLILGALNWRMRSVTPLSFTNYFMAFININDAPSINSLKNKATEIIIKAQNDIKLLEFNPSIISASALLTIAEVQFPVQFPSFTKAVSNCLYVDKGNLQRCYGLMKENYEVKLSVSYNSGSDETSENGMSEGFSSNNSPQLSHQ